MRDYVTFVLNGEVQRVRDIDPTLTVLNYLRRERRLAGTKEGCAEGDCGACTVVVAELADGQMRRRAVNACIQFVPMLDGKSVTTVEGIREPGGPLHPCQQAMVELHGSQCGFCTPGFVMSLYAAYVSGAPEEIGEINDLLAGNLCRCTGYGPIQAAARAMRGLPASPWQAARLVREHELLRAIADGETLAMETSGRRFYAPATADELARIYAEQSEATIVAGATDVGLWVTKQHRVLPAIIHLGRVAELRTIETAAGHLTIGAGVTYADAETAIAAHYPDFGELIRRLGSRQVRNAGTIGGNIANGSPIGDTPPALIALGATVTLRKGAAQRTLPLEDFFIAYGRQDRAPGEFVAAITVPLLDNAEDLTCFKISKRFDQDISAVCGCFNLKIEEERIAAARIAYGGMAATPRRARAVEAALVGAPWTAATIEAAAAAYDRDFQPISDVRGSSDYRLLTAKNLLRKVFHERPGARPQSRPSTRLVGRNGAFA